MFLSERRPLHRINPPLRSSLLNIRDRYTSIQGNTLVNLQNLSNVSNDLRGELSDSSGSSPIPGHCGRSNRSPSDLLLCWLNARSLRQFVDLLSDSKADLLAFTETWLTLNDTTALVEQSVPVH